jgi:hypothetical protein
MSLKQKLIDFGCGPEFVDIAMGFSKYYKPALDIEAFIEFVEDEFARIEAEEAKAKLEEESVDATELFDEFESEDEFDDNTDLYSEYAGDEEE